jgi:DNA-binding PadR family transcriptional regulator
MRSKSLPRLTHLQFLVLGLLRAGEAPGRLGREALGRHGVERTAPAIYQLLARLARDGLIGGGDEQVTVRGQAGTERRDRLRPTGAKLWIDARDFYAEIGARARHPRWSDA